ncbi:MAG TPA: hypothetical protein VGK53_22840 [Propionicimonas sp.]
MATMVEDKTWRALVTELKAWAIFVPSLLVFCAFAALAIAPTISPILGSVDPPWEPVFALSFWFGLLLFAVVRYAGPRPSTGQER